MLIFIVTFILYLFTLFPSTAPYRDTGEMVSVLHTLGVAHSPGYPLYTLIGKVFLTLVPWGNAAYRLNVLSALAGAGTAWFLYRLFVSFSLPRALAFFASLIVATSYLQWYLSLVSEMYTLNTLFAALLLFLVLKPSGEGKENAAEATPRYLLAAFLFGLGLGNRMDLLFVGAGLGWILWKNRRPYLLPFAPLFVILFFLGFSVFLYLPVRSGQSPWIDWNHPADLSRFWGSLTRKTHGGTLDLISSSYAAGENFPATMRFYADHLLGGFAWLGLPLGIVGLVSLFKRARAAATATLAAWLLAAPLFIFKANMPPNIHALVILEAHFLMPNVLFAFWMAEGLFVLFRRPQGFLKPAATAAAALMVCVNLYASYPHLQNRSAFIAYDYAKNVLRSLPRGAVVVMKKDVQLFALWARQFVERERRDIAVVAEGLSGSSWYQDSFRQFHPGVVLTRLSDPQGLNSFLELNGGRSVYITCDTDYPKIEKYQLEPDGLANRLTVSPNPTGTTLLDHIYTFRGRYLYTEYREFFTPDLIENYAHAHVELGNYLLRQNRREEGRKYLERSFRFQPLMPVACDFLAYSYFQEGNYTAARDHSLKAVEQNRATLELARKYNALPDALGIYAGKLSNALVSLGVCYERMKMYDESLEQYRRAIEASPNNAQAYFNRAAIYWARGRWDYVVSELENALRVDPNHTAAAFYLDKARQNLNASTRQR